MPKEWALIAVSVATETANRSHTERPRMVLIVPNCRSPETQIFRVLLGLHRCGSSSLPIAWRTPCGDTDPPTWLSSDRAENGPRMVQKTGCRKVFNGLRIGEPYRKRVAHLHGVGALGHPRGHLQLFHGLLGLLQSVIPESGRGPSAVAS